MLLIGAYNIHSYYVMLLPFAEVTDFDPIIAQDLIFAGDTTRQMCFDITIMNDEILENTEVFRVLILPTNDLALNFENTVLNIGIENDDSKPFTKGSA